MECGLRFRVLRQLEYINISKCIFDCTMNTQIQYTMYKNKYIIYNLKSSPQARGCQLYIILKYKRVDKF